MVVYLDLVFLMNFAINSLFVYLVNLLYKEKIKLYKIFLAGLFGGLLVLGFLFDYILYGFLKILGGAFVGLLGFKIGRFREMVVKISSFYIINFVSVGFVAAYRIKTWYLLAGALAAIILVFMVENNKKPIIFMNACKYNISVSSVKKSLNLVGYLDTGNFQNATTCRFCFWRRSMGAIFSITKRSSSIRSAVPSPSPVTGPKSLRSKLTGRFVRRMFWWCLRK